jgi:hypothetical protein
MTKTGPGEQQDIRKLFLTHCGAERYNRFLSALGDECRRRQRLMFWQQTLWEEFAAKHGIEMPPTLEALSDLFEGQPLVQEIVSKEQFLADPVRLWAKTPDPVPADWVAAAWANTVFREHASYGLARSVSKTGEFTLEDDALAVLPTVLTAQEAEDLYIYIRDTSERLESEWREQFEATFPVCRGRLPAAQSHASSSGIKKPKRKRSASNSVVAALGPAVRKFGFAHVGDHYFSRARGALSDVFFFDLLHPDKRQFCIYVGIDVPGWLNNLRDWGKSANRPSLWVSSSRGQHWYSCFDEQALQKSVLDVVADLEAEALPWFHKCETPSDVAAAYFQKEIATPFPFQDEHIGAPLRWAIYGFMLLECQKAQEAETWLRAAHSRLIAPHHTDGRMFSSKPFPKSRPMAPRPDDLNLARLIEQAGYGA